MKKYLLTLLFSISFISASFAQRNYHQELINLLQQEGQCFEARGFRTQHTNQLPQNDKTLDLVYKSKMAQCFNKPDSAAIYLEDLVTNQELILGPAVGPYYGKLLQLYIDNQQFGKGIDLCDRIIAYFIRNPFDLDSDMVQNEINSMVKAKSDLKYKDTNELPIKIERRKDSNESAIKLKDGEHIRFDAKYNGVSLQTLFDTGVTYYFFLTKQLADKIGVRVIDKKQDTIQLINKIPTKVVRGVIDSIDFESVKLYNIPVLVFNENLTSHLADTLNNGRKKEMDADLNDGIVMGLPTMLLIGKIEFDWEKRAISFPESAEQKEKKNSPNMFLVNRYLYQRLKINGLRYSGYLDTGDDSFLSMNFSFLEKYRNWIEIDSIPHKEPLSFYGMTNSSTFLNIPYELVKDPQIYLNGEYLNPDKSRVIVADKAQHVNTFDGMVSVNFFRRMAPKLIFDFDTMRVEGKSE